MKITEKSDVELFVKGWDSLVQNHTGFRYDWSYIVAWVGVGMCLGSAILFGLSSLCIKGDKEREEAMNMQYLMPGNFQHPVTLGHVSKKRTTISVYPQKGQPYGPYGYAAYPGPYHYGSQYGLSYSQY